MGTRTAPAPARPIGARDARGLRLPPQRTWGTPAGRRWGEKADPASWTDDLECEPVVRHELFATLVQPERADSLDFSGFLPVVRSPRPLPRGEPQREAEAVETRIPATKQPKDQPLPLARRVAQASMRLSELGRVRPVVRIPASVSQRKSGGASTRMAKLPPMWLLANALILIAAMATILPRIVTADAAAGCAWHVVVPGDTLGNLGWANHTNAMTIAQANHIANPNLIYVGQRLCIPMVAGAHTATEPVVHAGAKPATYGSAKGVQSFLTYVLPYAQQAHNATGWPVSMILAQWGLEQAWRVPGYTGFNFGNVAALPGEPTVNGIAVPGSPAAFAYARSPQDGLRYYLRVAALSYYSRVAPAARAGGPDAAARALGASPWDAAHYTAIGSPGSSLLSLMQRYNLYTYDH